jgi:hypothetical protein
MNYYSLTFTYSSVATPARVKLFMLNALFPNSYSFETTQNAVASNNKATEPEMLCHVNSYEAD